MVCHIIGEIIVGKKSVPGKFVNDATEALDLAPQDRNNRSRQFPGLLGISLVQKGGEAADVAEQDRSFFFDRIHNSTSTPLRNTPHIRLPGNH